MLLDGKAAVISGAASPRGIGRATARLFAGHGARRLRLQNTSPIASAPARAATSTSCARVIPQILTLTRTLSGFSCDGRARF